MDSTVMRRAAESPLTRPLIGISSEDREVVSTALTADCVSVAREYGRCVWAAGGIPVVLPVLDEAAALETVSRLDGLVLTGGGDLDPVWYGETAHPRTYDVQAERDRYEMALLDHCAADRKPVLAICRGEQIVNAHRGGTLHRHLADEPIDHWQMDFQPAHKVVVASESRLARIYGAGERLVNSFHHQGLATLGKGLRATAHADDGTVEAIESTDDHWLVGVQWHPERPWPVAPAELALFEALVAEASPRSRQALSESGLQS